MKAPAAGQRFGSGYALNSSTGIKTERIELDAYMDGLKKMNRIKLAVAQSLVGDET